METEKDKDASGKDNYVLKDEQAVINVPKSMPEPSSIYPTVRTESNTKNQASNGSQTSRDSERVPERISAYAILSRLVFLLVTALIIGAVFGEFIQPQTGQLGDALASSVMTPAALIIQIIVFYFKRRSFPLWLAYPLVGLGSIAADTITRLFGLIVTHYFATGLLLFYGYFSIFLLETVVMIIVKRRKLSVASAVALLSLFMGLGLALQLLGNAAREGLKLRLPEGEGFSTSTACIDGGCSVTNEKNVSFFDVDYKGEESYSGTVRFRIIKYIESFNPGKVCDIVDSQREAKIKYEKRELTSGKSVYQAMTSFSVPAIYPDGRSENSTNEFWYYCFTSGLYAYEIRTGETFNIEAYMESLRPSLVPVTLKAYYGL